MLLSYWSRNWVKAMNIEALIQVIPMWVMGQLVEFVDQGATREVVKEWLHGSGASTQLVSYEQMLDVYDLLVKGNQNNTLMGS